MTQVRALQTSRLPAMGQAYPPSLILTVFGLARSTLYEREEPRRQPPALPSQFPE